MNHIARARINHIFLFAQWKCAKDISKERKGIFCCVIEIFKTKWGYLLFDLST